MMLFGKITVKIEDNIIYELDIIAKNNIRKKEIKDYYMDFMKNMSNWWRAGIKNKVYEYI